MQPQPAAHRLLMRGRNPGINEDGKLTTGCGLCRAPGGILQVWSLGPPPGLGVRGREEQSGLRIAP